MTGLWVVLKHKTGGGFTSFGPIEAIDPEAAITQLAGTGGKYVAQGHGRYNAIPLEVWQDGCRDWTKTRGCERIEFPRISETRQRA